MQGADAVSATVPKSPVAWKVGVVHLGHQTEAPVVVGLRQGLKDLGYVEGRDIVLEIRAGRGQYSTALAAAEELVKTRVDILVSAGTVATQAVKEAAGNRPVVFTQVGERACAEYSNRADDFRSVESIVRRGCGRRSGVSAAARHRAQGSAH